jgi:hypothetical protein
VDDQLRLFPMADAEEISMEAIVDVARLWARRGRTPTGEVLRYVASGGLAHPHQGSGRVTGRSPGAWGTASRKERQDAP